MKNILLAFLTILLIFSLSFSGALGYIFYSQNRDFEDLKAEFENYKKGKEFAVEEIIKNPNISELENIKNIPKKDADISSLYISGWVPDWDIPAGLSTLQNQTSNFSGVSPVWFWVNEDGSLKETSKMNDPEFIKFSKNSGIELVPTVSLFDADILSKVLNNEENFNRHVEQIINQVVTNDYDGIDLDYESTYLKDKEKFFDLLEQISFEMAKIDKKFVFTVLPKWGDEVAYKYLPETRMVQDYKRIADLTDEFRIMTYEYSGRSSASYGPVAPLSWMEDVIRYAIYSGVPREKILLGVHTYSYNYSDRSKMETLDYYPVLNSSADESKEAGLAYFPNDVKSVINETGAAVTFEESWGEAIAEYVSSNTGEKRFIVFPNQRSIDLRKQLAADYGLKGVVYWRIGNDADLEY